MNVDLNDIVAGFQQLQDEICAGLESLDGKGKFQEDAWNREEGGGGRSRVISGDIIEKGGVNFSHVHGPMPEKISNRLNLPVGTDFHATGVSIVLHAKHPHIPIIHMNVRYFQTSTGKYWFGGGIDVTPIYGDENQAIWFHEQLRNVCDKYPQTPYVKFKQWADRYFYLKHRDETRGIGGIFFDHLFEDSDAKKAQLHEFVMEVGRLFVPIYTYLVNENREKAITEANRHWQSLRRSRYVEFNLIWDTGTRFGLDTGGRTESILMSMPPMAKWVYNHRPTPGSPEAATLDLLRPLDWLGLEG